jgi:pyruvate kinase|tara:strand:- start:58 stop:204 length:147 start_codon:yes stop_codon:yes gene_type:complete
MRKTKIIATIGPKTESEEMIKKLSDGGMNIARINPRKNVDILEIRGID